MSTLYDRGAGALHRVYAARVSGPPVFEPPITNFASCNRYIAAWRVIREEALAIASDLEQVPRFHELMPEQAAISANDGHDWRMFILKAYGTEVVKNMAACPNLAGLVRDTPEVVSATLSFLAPHKHIPPHRGPFKGILRFHLMLTMPLDKHGMPAAILIVDGREVRLGEGDCLLWDDTFEHEVWNRSDNVRIALLLDVWRPTMPIDMRILSGLIMLLVQSAMRLRRIKFGD